MRRKMLFITLAASAVTLLAAVPAAMAGTGSNQTLYPQNGTLSRTESGPSVVVLDQPSGSFTINGVAATGPASGSDTWVFSSVTLQTDPNVQNLVDVFVNNVVSTAGQVEVSFDGQPCQGSLQGIGSQQLQPLDQGFVCNPGPASQDSTTSDTVTGSLSVTFSSSAAVGPFSFSGQFDHVAISSS